MIPPARRDFLALMASGVALVTARALAGCTPARTVAPRSWATGGTAAMRDRATYPNPFADETPASTVIKCTCQLTEGPCYSSQAETRQDISYGYGGLPTRFYFQVLDESGAPVPQATVDVWHASAVGKYSGHDTAHEDVSFCTGDDPSFSEKMYFRGKQTTDDQGLVFFDSCFPGWYHGRTVHVHLTISVGGKSFVTTQFCFDDKLVDSIVTTQAIYASRGARDTTDTNDGVFDPENYAAYEFETAQMSDGAMLAWKSIVLRKALTEPICGDQGGPPHGPPGGPHGGPGGPPGAHGPPPPGWHPGPPPVSSTGDDDPMHRDR